MPCMCWYEPDEKNKKIFKSLCQQLVDHIKLLNKTEDAYGCRIDDAQKLLDHLYYGQCDEKSKNEK